MCASMLVDNVVHTRFAKIHGYSALGSIAKFDALQFMFSVL